MINKLILLWLVVTSSLLYADVQKGRWCYETMIDTTKEITLFAQEQSVQQWLILNRDNQAGFLDYIDSASKEIQQCSADVMSAVLYARTQRGLKKEKKLAKRCYKKNFQSRLELNWYEFAEHYTIQELILLYDNDAQKLLQLKTKKGVLAQRIDEKCLLPMLKLMIQESKDSPKTYTTK